MDKLTPTLNDQQIRQNIDAMKGKLPDAKIQDYVNNYTRTPQGTYTLKSPAKTTTPSLAERGQADIKSAGEDVYSAIQGEGQYAGQSAIRRGTSAVATAFGTPLKVASEALPEPVRQGLGAVGSAAGGIVNWLGEKLGSTQLAQDFVTKHPDAAKSLEEAAGTAANLGSISGNILAADAAAKGLQKTTDLFSSAKEAKPLTDYVDRIRDTHVNMAKDPEVNASMGDMTKNITSVKQDILDNFSPRGFDADPKVVDALSKLDPSKFSSVEDFADAAKDTINQTVKSPVGKAVSSVTDKFKSTPNPEEEISSIQDTISPKLNAKEVKTAISEGRVTRGEESKLFGKQPDVIAPSEDVTRAAQTIHENIPGAADMNDAQLHSALQDHISDTAESLRGDMQNVPVKPNVTGKVIDTWKDIKAAQVEEPEFDAFAGSAKSQAKFESYLKKLNWDITDESGSFKTPTPKTLDDIWQTRIDYDNSIPSNVKSATDLSAPQLQWQKSMWLQNRSILNDAIHDTASVLGDTSRDAFSKMSDMYSASNNILSKAKIDLTGAAGGSKVGGFLKSHPTAAKVLKYGAVAGGTAAGIPIAGKLLH